MCLSTTIMIGIALWLGIGVIFAAIHNREMEKEGRSLHPDVLTFMWMFVGVPLETISFLAYMRNHLRGKKS